MPILRDNKESTSDMDGLYSDEESEPSMPEESESSEAPEPHTELISSKMVMGKEVKPGDRIILEVVKNYGDEIEVKYGSEEKEKPSSMSEDEELAALAE